MTMILPRSIRPAVLLLLVAWGLRFATPAFAEDINPPFGLRWGETPDRMERLLQGAKATIVERRNVDGRDAWDVEGLIQTGLKRTVFYFYRVGSPGTELEFAL